MYSKKKKKKKKKKTDFDHMMAHISPYVYPLCFQSHSEKKNLSTIFAITSLRDSRQILHLILGEFKGINDLYSP